MEFQGAGPINDAVPIIDISVSFIEILRAEVIIANRSFKYADEDIVSAKPLGKRRNILRILGLPFSIALDLIADEFPKGFEVVIQQSLPSNPPKAMSCPFKLMMAASKLKQTAFTSKLSFCNVTEFWSGYEIAPSKYEYLSSFQENKKPSIHDQVEAVLVNFLLLASLGYQKGSGGKEVRAKKAMSLAIQVIAFAHKHRDTLSRSQQTRFTSSTLLRDSISVVCTKVCQGKTLPYQKIN